MDNKALRTGIALLATGLLLTACGDVSHDSDHAGHDGVNMDSGATTSVHNDADVVFAQDMVGHHQQAVDMAKLAKRTSNAEVQGLATRIEQAQEPEIRKMQGWLGQWGSGAMAPMPGMAHGSMPGMMSDVDMRKLSQAKGADFDRMFVQMMIKHHQGGVDMAKTEVADGANPDAKGLANSIISSQTAEINEMNRLLPEL